MGKKKRGFSGSSSSRNAEHPTPSNKDSKDLMQAALADLARSGLDKADFKKLQFEVMDSEATEEFVGEPRSSYKIPYFNLDGSKIAYSRVRFLESKRKKFNKAGRDGSFRYSQPFNSSPHVYLPPYFNWRKLAKNTAQKILITEGEKKAAAACKQGIACIALGGVYGFTSSKRFYGLIPEMREFDWKDRQVEVCYDADVMMKSEVRAALSALAMTLTQDYSPASLEFVFLDAEVAGAKTGLDDYLLEHGAEGFDKLPRQAFQANAKIQLLNQKICFVRKTLQFFDIDSGKYFKNLNHLREAYMTEGEEMIDGKRTAYIVDLWAKNANRRTVADIVYKPGAPESEHDVLNLWKAPPIQPKKANPSRWVELVHFIMRTDEYTDWFMKWLAYPVQHPGAKMLQAPFIYGKKQGIGKTFVVDPVMEFVYGPGNFHRLSNTDVRSQFNEFAGRKQFVVTNEIYLPDFGDRRDAMSSLKDVITRETVTVNEKFQPRVTFRDYCNYYFSSNHADALVLERGDRRFFVIEAPDVKLEQSLYNELDRWVREGDGGSVILHYLQNLDLDGFDHRQDALMTKWKKEIIGLSMDPLAEFGERLHDDTNSLFMVNGSKPDLELFRAEDLLRLFEHTYPRYRFNVTVQRMGRILDDPRIEKRKVRVSADSPLQTLYAVFAKEGWRKKQNKDWAEHYKSNSRLFAGKRTH